MTSILAIDPGSERSAFLGLEDGQPDRFGILPNDQLLALLYAEAGYDVVVIEQIESYGMAVGREVFDTVHWSGRFTEAARPMPVVGLTRRKVKAHVCGDTKAKDTNIRAALIDRFGGEVAIRKGGPLFGISKDVWSALAVAITHAETGGQP